MGKPCAIFLLLVPVMEQRSSPVEARSGDKHRNIEHDVR